MIKVYGLGGWSTQTIEQKLRWYDNSSIPWLKKAANAVLEDCKVDDDGNIIVETDINRSMMTVEDQTSYSSKAEVEY